MAQLLADRLAEYAGQLRFEDLPAPVVHETKRRFIDSFATAVGAMDAEAYAIARRCALRVQSQPGAGMLGGGRTSPEWATFVNGLLIRYLDYNDTYLSLEPAHPSDNLSAVLAVGEMANAAGQDLITAAVLAYEIQCRLCDAASLRKHGWDHVTYGAISSALAACKLLGLDAARATQADGEVTMAQFSPERFADPVLLDLVAKIEVHRDGALSARYPRGIPNRLTVTLNDGRKLVREVEFPRGHAQNPMSDAEVEQKFRSMVEPRYG